MVLLLFSANNRAQAVKATRTMRSVSRNWRSPMCGTKGRSTFSVNSDVGASKAPLAVDRMAESRAPKNITCAHSGILDSTRSGRMRWISRPSSELKSLARLGSVTSAA